MKYHRFWWYYHLRLAVHCGDYKYDITRKNINMSLHIIMLNTFLPNHTGILDNFFLKLFTQDSVVCSDQQRRGP